MSHNRKIVLGGVSLTIGRLNRTLDKVMARVMDELEVMMVDSGYLEHAPFRWVSLIFRFGLKNEVQPHYGRIHPKHGDLPLAIELDTRELQAASSDELWCKLSLAALTALVHAGKKFNLPTTALEERYSEILEQHQRTKPDSPPPSIP